MRARGRVDANQPGIVTQLRELGCTVEARLSRIGFGCPDILVGVRKQNFAFEIKDPSKPPSQRELTPEETLWHQNWQGQIDTVTSLEEILEVLGLLKAAR